LDSRWRRSPILEDTRACSHYWRGGSALNPDDTHTWALVISGRTIKKATEIGKYRAVARRSGPAIAPQFAQELAHGYGPFNGMTVCADGPVIGHEMKAESRSIVTDRRRKTS
jgi:hypothetical protein